MAQVIQALAGRSFETCRFVLLCRYRPRCVGRMSDDLMSALGLVGRASGRDARTHERHRVFISFHEEDRTYKEALVEWLRPFIIDESVDTGSIIDTGLTDDQIWRKIRDEYIRSATVTIVLVGACTWQRKFVDWEIGGSLMKTSRNSRCGLVGILLPDHADFGRQTYRPGLLPPRLAANAGGEDPYARVWKWPFEWSGPKLGKAGLVADWIETAFSRREGSDPVNGAPRFEDNRLTPPCHVGWA